LYHVRFVSHFCGEQPSSHESRASTSTRAHADMPDQASISTSTRPPPGASDVAAPAVSTAADATAVPAAVDVAAHANDVRAPLVHVRHAASCASGVPWPARNSTTRPFLGAVCRIAWPRSWPRSYVASSWSTGGSSALLPVWRGIQSAAVTAKPIVCFDVKSQARSF